MNNFKPTLVPYDNFQNLISGRGITNFLLLAIVTYANEVCFIDDHNKKHLENPDEEKFINSIMQSILDKNIISDEELIKKINLLIKDKIIPEKLIDNLKIAINSSKNLEKDRFEALKKINRNINNKDDDIKNPAGFMNAYLKP